MGCPYASLLGSRFTPNLTSIEFHRVSISSRDFEQILARPIFENLKCLRVVDVGYRWRGTSRWRVDIPRTNYGNLLGQLAQLGLGQGPLAANTPALEEFEWSNQAFNRSTYNTFPLPLGSFVGLNNLTTLKVGWFLLTKFDAWRSLRLPKQFKDPTGHLPQSRKRLHVTNMSWIETDAKILELKYLKENLNAGFDILLNTALSFHHDAHQCAEFFLTVRMIDAVEKETFEMQREAVKCMSMIADAMAEMGICLKVFRRGVEFEEETLLDKLLVAANFTESQPH
ncbi:hypothetical protein BS50DRAFT_594425 [Corynespora cassiicola Philippines]|uniref:Uncharacterized protein n=1 Tax=Corynespora cassiicola Philippines TaxID=1448308 RepID=A0A2T2N2X4_CORCC|nr:hypothetical protein BS50DRAFT_594425 [Corynespora cassiicola Philippines]